MARSDSGSVGSDGTVASLGFGWHGTVQNGRTLVHPKPGLLSPGGKLHILVPSTESLSSDSHICLCPQVAVSVATGRLLNHVGLCFHGKI